MTKVATLQAIAKRHTRSTDSPRIAMALVGFLLHLSHHSQDYAGATTEAAYDLEPGDEGQFMKALESIRDAFPARRTC